MCYFLAKKSCNMVVNFAVFDTPLLICIFC